ncbi:MAG: arylsulfatase A-like enzyme [Hyphomicrobiaceae bacterium]
MKQLLRHVAGATWSALFLACISLVVEAVAFALVWAGQVAAPFGFFTNQSWNFLAKIREFADPVLFWAPGLPDRFTDTSTTAHIGLAISAAPSVLSTAVLVGVAIGCLASLLSPRRKVSLRAWLLIWTGLGICVHSVAAIGPLNLGEMSRWGQFAYRLRSLIVDGTAVAVAVAVISFAIAWLVAPRVGNEGRSKTPIVALAALLLASGLALKPSAPSALVVPFTPSSGTVAGKQNVLLISLDSLRADHVHCYGYERETSPTIDRLAAEGVRFANAISTSSWTLPAHLTMFTSRYQTSHGVAVDTHTLNSSIPTLGEIMKAAGYATAGFISGPYVAGHYGYDRGMDTYVDLSQGYDHRAEARATIASPAINEHALDWLAEHHEEPFFLFLHYFDIHYDFIPPPPYDSMFDPDYTGTMDGTLFIERKDVNADMNPRDLEHIKALYDGEIRFTDEHVGLILDRLRDYGVLDNTLVVLVSDHGDEFFEHGNKGHHRTVYDEVLRVPFVVRLPGGDRAGTVIEDQASLVDVMPTILGHTGIAGPPHMEGRNILRTPHADNKREAVYAEFYDKRGFNVQVARRTLQSKVIQHFNRITHPSSDAVEFYDIAADPDEQHDLHPLNPGAGARETDELDHLAAWIDQSWRNWREFQHLGGDAGPAVEIDDEMAERLRQLGYVSD